MESLCTQALKPSSMVIINLLGVLLCNGGKAVDTVMWLFLAKIVDCLQHVALRIAYLERVAKIDSTTPDCACAVCSPHINVILVTLLCGLAGKERLFDLWRLGYHLRTLMTSLYGSTYTRIRIQRQLALPGL